jgi:oligoendopeptidase F
MTGKISNFILFNEASVQTTTEDIPTRDKIEQKYKWNLKDIYSNDDEWEKDFKWIKENVGKYQDFQSTLNKSSRNLKALLKFDEEVGIKLERLNLYAMLAKDSDMSVTKFQGMEDRIVSLFTEVSAASSYIKPGLLSIPEEKIGSFFEEDKSLKEYEHFFQNLFREKPHTLSKELEHIIALTNDFLGAPYNTYSIFTNSDFKFPKVKDVNGNLVGISHARFYAAMYSDNREYRKNLFKNYFVPYIQYVNTVTTLFNSNLKSNIFIAKARKYNSAREAALDKNNIPVSVYDNLVQTANQNLKPMHRWGEMKKKLLKIDELHPYDVYVTIFPFKNERKYEYDEAKEIVLDALKVLGEDYLNSLKYAYNNRWIDVYETKSKRSGAYSSGTTFGVHPYVLLNWSDLLNDVFTLAHEMGHNMHSHYTGKTQPFIYSNYTIFLAEVASTFNESLLLDYLIENAENKEQKLFLIEKYLNNISSTFYRQTMFAEFEMWAYEQTERGIALTSDVLSEKYRSLYQKYWGPAMVVDKEEEYTWSRIPHFYYNFYVFQYATGFAASEVLANKVKTEGELAVKRYLNFLKAGSSDYSINVLSKAGVDMNSPEPVSATTKKMNQLLDELESLI